MIDAVALLNQLGATFSPDLSAYARGELPVSAVRCVLCEVAPCACFRCPAEVEPGRVCNWVTQPGKPCRACETVSRGES